MCSSAYILIDGSDHLAILLLSQSTQDMHSFLISSQFMSLDLVLMQWRRQYLLLSSSASLPSLVAQFLYISCTWYFFSAVLISVWMAASCGASFTFNSLSALSWPLSSCFFLFSASVMLQTLSNFSVISSLILAMLFLSSTTSSSVRLSVFYSALMLFSLISYYVLVWASVFWLRSARLTPDWLGSWFDIYSTFAVCSSSQWADCYSLFSQAIYWDRICQKEFRNLSMSLSCWQSIQYCFLSYYSVFLSQRLAYNYRIFFSQTSMFFFTSLFRFSILATRLLSSFMRASIRSLASGTLRLASLSCISQSVFLVYSSAICSLRNLPLSFWLSILSLFSA